MTLESCLDRTSFNPRQVVTLLQHVLWLLMNSSVFWCVLERSHQLEKVFGFVFTASTSIRAIQQLALILHCGGFSRCKWPE